MYYCNHTMGFPSLTYIPLLVLSFSILVFNLFVLANSKLPLLHQMCHDHEKLALLRFKQSFLVDCGSSFAYSKVNSWHKTDHFHVTNGSSSTGDCCEWDGVKCDKVTGHVIGLDLSSSCLYGTLTSNNSLFGLDHLLELNLADNHFRYSQIPFAIGRLHKLTHLNLSKSAFSGQIPLEISNLSSLSLLDLSHNGNGNIVSDQFDLKLHDLGLQKLVYSLPRLTILNLARVDISSFVPPMLGNRTSLKVLNLRDCNLLGQFPSNVFLLTNIEVVSLFYNPNLRGYLPEFQSNSPLRDLTLGGTGFSGELPASLGSLGSLRTLHLMECYFSGQIPSSIGNLTALTFINLSGNFFSGDLPLSIMNLMRLHTLVLSNFKNVEPGILKSWLSKLNSLTELHGLGLNDMNLGNEILPTLSNLSRLTYLDLRSNLFTGPLPSEFMNLTNLNLLDLYNNHLQGSIPLWISNLKFLEFLSLSFKGTVGILDSMNLPHLRTLYLSGVSLTFSQSLNINSSLLKLQSLGLVSCNLTEFPNFLQYQDELQELDLSDNSIAGQIPQWFMNTTSATLLSLDLSNNLLVGFEQPDLALLPWNNLKFLNFNSNKLQQPLPIPPSSLQAYRVSNNQFYGVIPLHICRAASLVFLDLSENNLTGQIPSCIGHQISGSLQVLNLRGNNLSGIIPQTFSTTCKLKMINLSQNQLAGKLPKSLVNCRFLEVLDVGRNSINETFPSWLGSLPKLQVLVLSHNNFHGKIIAPPFDYRDFHSLRIIDLSYNFYSGTIPSRYIQSWLAMTVSDEGKPQSSNTVIKISIMSVDSYTFDDELYVYSITITNKGRETYYSKILNVFRVIDISSNKFTGRIPKIIGNLRGLQGLNLSNNNLGGGIPLSMANITDLESLDLSGNKLSGMIPPELTRLTFLAVFNVSHNHLVGPIPQGKQFNTFDNSSFGGNLGLCGVPLTEKCQELDTTTPSLPQGETDDDETEKDSDLIDWIIRSLGCASGFIVGFVIGKVFITDKHHDWFMETFGKTKRRSKTRVRRSAPRRRGGT